MQLSYRIEVHRCDGKRQEREVRTLMVSIALLAITSLPAKADRPVTEAERAKLVEAVTAQGCSGGKLEYDAGDREFEVDKARCSDGRNYDLKFNEDYTFKSKKLDD
jgi:hypothetical protein